MEKDRIVVGKYVLDNLIQGMYTDSKILYREYVQNAVDSIRKAIEMGLISEYDGQIWIKINHEIREISIKDNGLGISSEKIFHTLGDIANSTKKQSDDLGFRGIGRLGGFYYAQKAQFITSYKGEKIKSIMTWDCEEIKRLLSPLNREVEDVVELVEKVTTIEREYEDENEHYLEVKLIGVSKDFDNLLDKAKIRDYLAQVCPVPFNGQSFPRKNEIESKFKEVGQPLLCCKVQINDDGYYINKAYALKVKTTNSEDYITDVDYICEKDEQGEIKYLGWIGKTKIKGKIQDELVQGIRIRLGNIMIGDDRTIGEFFPRGQEDSRCFVGEIHVFDKRLIPNGRRDKFEENPAYFEFVEFLKKNCKELSQKRSTASKVNSSINNFVKSKIEIEKIEIELQKPTLTKPMRDNLNKKKGTLEKKVTESEKEINKLIKSDTTTENQKSELRKALESSTELKDTSAQKGTSTPTDERNPYKNTNAYELPTSYSREERKLYNRIATVIDDYFINHFKDVSENKRDEIRNELREKILEELKVKKKK